MEKIRVLHIVEGFGGGVFGALQAMVNGTNDQFEVYVMYALRNATPRNFKQIFKPGTHFIKSEFLTREINPLQDIRACAEIRRVVKKIKPDVVHLHSSKAGAIGRLALDGRRMPILYSPQGYSFLMFDASPGKRRMYFAMEKLLGFRPSLTVASCAGEYDSARRVSRRATYINNGIDPIEIDRFGLDTEQRPDEIKVCTLGRVVAQKNPELFNQIASRFPNIRFVWIGGGELEEQLTSPNIEVTGWLPKDKALEIMMGTSVFMLTSLYEGLAFSIMEAMYLKRLCVVSRIPGNVDAIENGKTGYICDTLDDYVSVLEKLKENGIDETILQAAHGRIVEDLNQTVMARKYMELYQKEIANIEK